MTKVTEAVSLRRRKEGKQRRELCCMTTFTFHFSEAFAFDTCQACINKQPMAYHICRSSCIERRFVTSHGDLNDSEIFSSLSARCIIRSFGVSVEPILPTERFSASKLPLMGTPRAYDRTYSGVAVRCDHAPEAKPTSDRHVPSHLSSTNFLYRKK